MWRSHIKKNLLFFMERLIEDKKWYVIYTRSRCEKKVSSLLLKRSIETYCPLNKCYRKWSDRTKIVLEPLFRSYVFVKVNHKEIDFVKQQSSDIVNIVYWLGEPAVVKNEEIDHIRFFLGEYHDVKIEKITVNINDSVRIRNGPMMNMTGKIEKIENNMVKITIPSLGYMLTSEIRSSNIEVIDRGLLKSKDQLFLEMQ